MKGSYADEEAALPSSRNRPECSGPTVGIVTYPANHNLSLNNSQNSQNPLSPALLYQPRHDQQSSRYSVPYQPNHGVYGPPPSYNQRQSNDEKATFRSGPSAPHGIHGTKQQPAYLAPIANDPRSVVVTNPPSATGQCIVSQPQVSGGQPPAFVIQPRLEKPPPHYLGYSIFVTLCCCWIIGVIAIYKSSECRSAIAVGNHRLAEKKSVSARDTANASLVWGIVAYIVYAVILWNQKIG